MYFCAPLVDAGSQFRVDLERGGHCSFQIPTRKLSESRGLLHRIFVTHTLQPVKLLCIMPIRVFQLNHKVVNLEKSFSRARACEMTDEITEKIGEKQRVVSCRSCHRAVEETRPCVS